MIITKLSEQIKRPERVNIFLDGKYSFSLTLSQLLDEKLKVGTEISADEEKRLKKLSDDGKLKARALEWLMLRPRSAKECGDYLRRKGLEQEQIQQWLSEFQAKSYQSDEYFSKWWVEQRQHKLRSSSYIRQELRSKGVASDVIEQALDSKQSSEGDLLKQLIAKKQQAARYQDPQKLTAYLMRQGYRYSEISDALAE